MTLYNRASPAGGASTMNPLGIKPATVPDSPGRFPPPPVTPRKDNEDRKTRWCSQQHARGGCPTTGKTVVH